MKLPFNINLREIKISKEESKRLIKPFLFIFLISFLVINWDNVSWVFNYRTVSGIFINSMPDLSSSPTFNFFEKIFKENAVSQAKIVKRPSGPGSLEIPKLGLKVPVIFLESGAEKDLSEALNKGAVHFTSSALPGENGQTVILGHSAPKGWPQVGYDWVFSRINELEPGDEIILYAENQKYSYKVSRKLFLDRGEEISKNELTKERNILVLISCWPPGKDIKRIAVESDQI